MQRVGIAESMAARPTPLRLAAGCPVGMTSGAACAGGELRTRSGQRARRAASYLRAASLDEASPYGHGAASAGFHARYDVLVRRITQLRKLDRKAALAFAFSHRSYLDGMLPG